VLPSPEPEGDRAALSNLTNFQLAEWAFRDVVVRPTQQGAMAKIKAAESLARLLSLKANLPKNIIEGREEVTLEEERTKLLQEMSPAEMAKEYKRMIDRA
jgi:hypothetical protein